MYPWPSPIACAGWERIASERQEAGLAFVGILFAHQRGVSLGQLVEDLELIASCGEPAEFGDRLVDLPL